jgi:hypothetical protein
VSRQAVGDGVHPVVRGLAHHLRADLTRDRWQVASPRASNGYSFTVSELLPNLSALLQALPPGTRGDDARLLAAAASEAVSQSELDGAIAAVVQEWLQG